MPVLRYGVKLRRELDRGPPPMHGTMIALLLFTVISLLARLRAPRDRFR